jgi:hypothetical protein
VSARRLEDAVRPIRCPAMQSPCITPVVIGSSQPLHGMERRLITAMDAETTGEPASTTGNCQASSGGCAMLIID